MTENQQPNRRELRPARSIGVALGTMTVALVSATVAGHFSGLWWPFTMVEHLRIQLFWALLLVGGGLAVLRWRWWTAAAAAALTLNLVVLLPYWFGGASTAEPTLTLLHLNTDRGRNSVLTYIEDSIEDVVLLQEVTPALAERLDDLEHHRLVLAHPRDNTHGSAVLVRRDWPGEVVDSDVIHIPETNDRPLLRADLLVDDRSVTVLSYHAIRPGGAARTTFHSDELGYLAAWVEAHEGEAIVIGDFNATPWSKPIRGLESADMTVSTRGNGLEGTWPATRPELLQIPIDLCLHTFGWETVSNIVGPSVGGDHRPLHVGLAAASDS